MTNTTTVQGNFTSTGADVTLQLPSGVDWIRVYNYTQSGTTQSTGRSVEYYWQRDMAAGTGLIWTKTNSSNALNANVMLTGGFTLVNSSVNSVGALNSTITGISNASTPVVSLTSTAGLADGSIVRLFNVAGGQQLGGIDFTIGSVVTDTSFTLAYMAQIATATTGSLRPILYEPMFYPRHRYISAISKASQAVVKMTVTHGFTVGQEVRLVVPADYGMVEANGLQGQITAISTVNNTITLNIDSSAFTTFAFPVSAAAPFSPAMVVPIGEGADESVANPNLLDDATVNTAYIGINLGANATLPGSATSQGPAGSNGDVVYWQAGVVFANN